MQIPMPTQAEMVQYINPFEAKNLTFEGGGAAGIGYVGAIQALEEQRFQPHQSCILEQIERVAGTSAGAITAYLIAIGCSSREVHRYLAAQSLQDMVYKHWYTPFTWNIFREYGAYEKDKVSRWLETITAEKLGPENRRITFEQLQNLRNKNLATDPSNQRIKELSVCVTNLTTQHLDIFCANSPRYKNTPIVDAVAMGSIAIPLYFKAWRYLGNFFVDGGVIANDPQMVFDKPASKHIRGGYDFNEETLAFRLDTQADVVNMIDGDSSSDEKQAVTEGGFFSTQIKGLISYIKALVSALQQSQLLFFTSSYNAYRTISIPRAVTLLGKVSDVGATEFDMPKEAQMQLIANGYQATNAHFAAARVALEATKLSEDATKPTLELTLRKVRQNMCSSTAQPVTANDIAAEHSAKPQWRWTVSTARPVAANDIVTERNTKPQGRYTVSQC